MGADDTPTPDNPSLAAELVTWAQSQASVSKMRDTASAADKAVTTAGNDPDYMPSIEAFMSMRHADILKAVNAMQPGMMHQSSQAWRNIGDALMFNNMGLAAKLQKTISQGWEGATATSISDVTRRFTDEIANMHNVTQSVASRIESAAYGAETVKGAVPSIPESPGSPAVPGAENPATVIGHITAASDAEQAAQRAMVTYYVPSYQPAGQQVPIYVPSTAPDSNSGPATPAVSHPGSTTGTGTQNPSSPHAAPGDSKAAQQNQNNRQTTPTGSGSSESGNSNSGQHTPGAVTGTDPSATTTAGVGPGSSTPGSTPSWTGGTGDLGTVSPPGGPGRSIPGVPETSNVTTASALGATRAASAAGAAGMPGIGMPGAKTKKEDEDKEHKGRPELLAHERNKRELIGDPVKATPPVFGRNPPPKGQPADRRPDNGEDTGRR